MPISVRIPVTWVVRISASESLLMTAFCRTMMKASSMMVSGTTRPSMLASRAQHAKTEKQHGFDHQRQCVLAVHASPPGKQHQHRRACHASDKREQCSRAGQYRLMRAQHKIVGHG